MTDRPDGPMTRVGIKGMLTVLDEVEGELEALRREDAGNDAAQAAYEKVERALVRIRCELQDAIDGVQGRGENFPP